MANTSFDAPAIVAELLHDVPDKESAIAQLQDALRAYAVGGGDGDIAERLAAVAAEIIHCGDYGNLWFKASEAHVWWTAGDADFNEDEGYTGYEEVKTAFTAVAGVKQVTIGDEYDPVESDGDDGWHAISFKPSQRVLDWHQAEADRWEAELKASQDAYDAKFQAALLEVFTSGDVYDQKEIREQLPKQYNRCQDGFLRNQLAALVNAGKLQCGDDWTYRLS